MLSLAAGTVPDASPAEAIDAATRAGYDAVGIRFERPPSAADVAGIRCRLDDAGVGALDVEVARIRPGCGPDEYAWLVDAAGALGARFLLVVSEDPDVVRTARLVGDLGRRARAYELSVAVEFMMFTTVKTVADASAVIARAAQPNAVLLVDALHLARSGTSPERLRVDATAPIGYVQICDAPLAGPRDESGLATEARHGRLLPGYGELPLADLLGALGPDVPVSVEVQSDELIRTTSPQRRAAMAMAAARGVIGRSARRRQDGMETR